LFLKLATNRPCKNLTLSGGLMGTGEVDRDWILALRQKLALLPQEFEECKQQLHHIRASFHREICNVFESRINAEIRSRPQNTYDEKRELSSWVNQEARDMGLTVTSPKSGSPSILNADYATDKEKDSRFRIISTSSDGQRHSVILRDLTKLRFQQAPPREEGSTVLFRRRRVIDKPNRER
jgi:hypothetical protein